MRASARYSWLFAKDGEALQAENEETSKPAAPDEYRVRGSWTKAQVFDETIRVKGAPDEHLKVVVTRHGPIVRRDADKAYALRWTATEPGGLANTYNWMGKARN